MQHTLSTLPSVIATVACTTVLAAAADDPDVPRLHALLEAGLESRPYHTTLTQTQFAGTRADASETWLLKLEVRARYMPRAARFSCREQYGDRDAVDTWEMCYADGRFLQWVETDAGPDAIAIHHQMKHPGFNEFVYWFNLVYDRMPERSSPILAAADASNILRHDDDADALHIRFARGDRHRFQTELVFDAETERLRQVHLYYAAPLEANRSFEDRLQAHYAMTILEWKQYGDDLVLPRRALMQARYRPRDTWKAAHYIYERMDAELLDADATIQCEPDARPGASVVDHRSGAAYIIGRTQLRLDGTLYEVAEPIADILPVELEPVLKTATYEEGGGARRDAGHHDFAPRADAPALWQIILTAVGAGLGTGLVVYVVQRNLTARRG